MASHSVNQIVEEQARRWERVNQGAAKRPAKPCVAVSRLPYSGATELAQKLAIRLDYGVFGREIVDEIAKSEGIGKDLVAGLDEHVETAIDRHVLDGFRHRRFNETDYLRETVRIVTTLGMRGQTVIIGRGSASILPAESTLRVMVVSPFEARRDRFAKIRAVRADEATERLRREDEGRREFWKHNFSVEHVDPGMYDLAVNTTTLTIDGAVDLVEAAFRRRFPS
ncbi:MAG: cytidylate kinase-like family protein [Deltaproteobacteria bacterium]|nr:cytidylate kinase-like family protein [Deltaproteobacteria bacterium]